MLLTVNGVERDIQLDDSLPLLWAIRNELNLTGTKFGCGGGFCGSCTVHVDGEARRSCITPLRDVAGADVRTIEDLATENADGTTTLHPVQQAFLDEQVPQCSWCMSGQMMTAAAFLQTNSTPSDDEIVTAMGDNYCRCGCYVRIKAAVNKAAELMQVASDDEVAA